MVWISWRGYIMTRFHGLLFASLVIALYPAMLLAQSTSLVTNPAGRNYYVDGVTVWTHSSCFISISSISGGIPTSTLNATTIPSCVLVGNSFTIYGTNNTNYNYNTYQVASVSATSITFYTSSSLGATLTGSATNFRGVTMPDAILSLTAANPAGSFYENNCAEPAYAMDLFHLTFNGYSFTSYIQLYIGSCSNPIQTSVTQMPQSLDGIRGLPFTRGRAGTSYGGAALQASSTFPPPIPDPATPASTTSGSGCAYAGTTMYYEITLVAPSGADTAHSPEGSQGGLSTTSGVCWSLTLPQAAQAGMSARIYTSSTSGGELCVGTFSLSTTSTTSQQVVGSPASPNGPSATNATGALVVINTQSNTGTNNGPGVKTAQFGAVVSDITLDGNGLAAVCLYQNMGQEGTYVQNVDLINCPGGGPTSNAAAIWEGHNGGPSSTLCSGGGSCAFGPNNSYAINLRMNDASALSICFDGTFACNPGAGIGSSTGAYAGSQGTVSVTNGSSSVTWVSGTPFNASGAWNGQKLFINGTAVTCATCTSTTALTLSAVWGGSTGTFGYSGLGPGFAVLLDQVPSLRTVDGLTSTPNSGPTTVGVEVLGFPGWNSAIRIENIHNEGKSPWMQYAVECRGAPCLVQHANANSFTQTAVVHLSGTGDAYGAAYRSVLEEIEPQGTELAIKDDINGNPLAAGMRCEFYRVGGVLGDFDGCGVPRPVLTGGTGASTLTANGVLYGNGTSPVGITPAGSSNQALLGGTPPSFAAVPNAALQNSSITVCGSAVSLGGSTTNCATLTGTQSLSNKTLTQGSNGNSVTLLNAQFAGSSITGNGTAQNVYAYTIPASTIAIGKCVRATVTAAHSAGSASVSYAWTFGSASLSAGSTAQNAISSQAYVCNNGATNVQQITSLYLIGSTGVPNGAATGTGSNDTTTSQSLSFTFAVASTDAVTPKLWTVELVQ